MTDLGAYLSATGQTDGQPLRLELGQIVAWTAPGNNTITVLGNTVTNIRALAGVSLAAGDTVALLKSRGGYLAIGKVT